MTLCHHFGPCLLRSPSTRHSFSFTAHFEGFADAIVASASPAATTWHNLPTAAPNVAQRENARPRRLRERRIADASLIDVRTYRLDRRISSQSNQLRWAESRTQSESFRAAAFAPIVASVAPRRGRDSPVAGCEKGFSHPRTRFSPQQQRRQRRRRAIAPAPPHRRAPTAEATGHPPARQFLNFDFFEFLNFPRPRAQNAADCPHSRAYRRTPRKPPGDPRSPNWNGTSTPITPVRIEKITHCVYDARPGRRSF